MGRIRLRIIYNLSGDIIKQIFESGSVPSQLLKEIESHDLIGNLHNVLADTRAAKLDDEGLQQVNTYNDLLMAGIHKRPFCALLIL